MKRRTAGSATIEFAVTVMPMLLLLLGIIQGGIMFWRWQSLESAAIDAARCAGINATSCQDVATAPANTMAYAASIAVARGLSGVTSGNVIVTTGAAARSACGSPSTSVVSVALSYNFNEVYLVPLPSTLTASACFPLVSG